MLLFLFKQSKRVGLLQAFVEFFGNGKRKFVYCAGLQYIFDCLVKHQIFQLLFGYVRLVALFLMKFSVKAFIVVVDFARMARSVLGGHKRTAVATKKYSAEYVWTMVLHGLLLVSLVVHYVVASLDRKSVV